MTITIDLTPEQESTLKARAAARGMDLPEFAKARLLEGEDEPFRKFGTAEEEAADERAWADRFAASKDLLASMADEAAEERRNGLTVPLDTLLAE